MSTVDPAAVRRERRERQRGSTGALLLTVLGGLLLLIAGAVFGLGFGSALDTFRIMSLNSVFAGWETSMPLGAASSGMLIPAGVFGGIAAGAFYAYWNRRFAGGPGLRLAGIGPAPIALVGSAVGVSLAAAMWTEPFAVGVAVDPSFGNDEPWGAWEWIAYWAVYWVPALAIVLAILVIALGASTRRAASGREALIRELLVSGRRVPGEVTEAEVPHGDSDRVGMPWTVRFVDQSGTPRWVVEQGIFRRTAAPRLGQQVTVLFDPARPEDRRRIFVALGEGADPAAYSAHRF
ncbi:DUF3592 domain-containing protein [Homoserinibacter sp. YIM 151385]|uniref:DUF3592 domain-containing protein n=1 Tax=Homoserinibacter sp. YIM 151385 TaxID=2985506 RepID=UPI0022EFF231|nr:DUF3592 domain-containing protein [Homoserinibacter sp. YIM 151385]WBU37398.1 hypothetical protein OF852_10805 [Homoserinibacter sp. YIM 151385]